MSSPSCRTPFGLELSTKSSELRALLGITSSLIAPRSMIIFPFGGAFSTSIQSSMKSTFSFSRLTAEIESGFITEPQLRAGVNVDERAWGLA